MNSSGDANVKLAGKIAIVTGAAKGIGATISAALSASGAVVIVSDIDDDSGRKLVAQLEECGNKAVYVKADVSSVADVDRLFRTSSDLFSKIDILVNNVGIRHRKTLFEIPDEEWDQVINTNLSGTFRCTQRAARLMARAGGGSIVNITSQAGVFYSPGQGCHYAASKAAIIQLTRVLSFELGPLGIRINSIAPGSLSVERDANGTTAGANSNAAAGAPRSLDRIPLRRLGSADDVAQAVLFFVSDQSQFVTGQTLLVNGGLIT
jgi:3-oxoacyl-[acyl-carrier protein] reductase